MADDEIELRPSKNSLVVIVDPDDTTAPIQMMLPKHEDDDLVPEQISAVIACVVRLGEDIDFRQEQLDWMERRSIKTIVEENRKGRH